MPGPHLVVGATLLVLALAACTGPGASGDPTATALIGAAGEGSGSTEGRSAGEQSADAPAVAPLSDAASAESCLLAGSPWSVVTTDLANQMSRYFSSQGLAVSGVEIAGTQILTVNGDGTASVETDLTSTVEIDADGVTMTLVQTQTGPAAGAWRLSDDGAVFEPEGWTTGLAVTNQVFINGMASEVAGMAVPSSGFDDVPLTIACDGAYLDTKAQQSPFQQLWKPVS
ncbi:hypothetical protein [Compostimonas suwonensis]|uniref:Uncharacterized protein n=1 Tax=Compostimonas suwonensis TaxID=1048394 RepID=A0A2M9BZV9_9MICO|nr:hypothetical protein [Compostimonas suwonensis]PJJ63629.1 hypothetical protein CLV54_1299 [Compostimonas suwonensis]